MNIMIEGMSRELGGMEVFIMSVFRNLDMEQYKIDFIAYDERIVCEEEIVQSGSHVYHVTPRSKNISASKSELDRVFKEKKYDVFWSHKTTISNIEALKAAKNNCVPIRIVHSHSSKNRGTGFTYMMHRLNRRVLSKYVTEFLACSYDSAKWMFGHYAEKAEIVINGVDMDKFAYSREREMFMRKKLDLENVPVVGHIGRMSREKNHKFLLLIFKELLKKQKDAVLLLCGGGEMETEITESIRILGIEKNVRVLGVRNDVDDVMQVMNVFVFPSLMEGYPISLIEAQAAGLPSVVSKDVIPASIACDENMEFVSLNEKPEKWAEAVFKKLKLPRHTAPKSFVESNMNLKKMIENIEKILNRGGY